MVIGHFQMSNHECNVSDNYITSEFQISYWYISTIDQ